MKASLKGFFSINVRGDMKYWLPADKDFGINLTLFVGIDGKDKSDAFDVVLCTPHWFAAQPLSSEFTHGKYYIFVKSYSFEALTAHISECCEACSADDWQGLAMQINNWASWEFYNTIKALPASDPV